MLINFDKLVHNIDDNEQKFHDHEVTFPFLKVTFLLISTAYFYTYELLSSFLSIRVENKPDLSRVVQAIHCLTQAFVFPFLFLAPFLFKVAFSLCQTFFLDWMAHKLKKRILGFCADR